MKSQIHETLQHIADAQEVMHRQIRAATEQAMDEFRKTTGLSPKYIDIQLVDVTCMEHTTRETRLTAVTSSVLPEVIVRNGDREWDSMLP